MPRDRRRPRAGDVAAVVEDLAARRRQEMREQVEAGGLAGAVGADQRVDRAAADAQAHVLDRDEALELLGEPARFENRVVGHAAPARTRRTVSSSCLWRRLWATAGAEGNAAPARFRSARRACARLRSVSRAPLGHQLRGGDRSRRGPPRPSAICSSCAVANASPSAIVPRAGREPETLEPRPQRRAPGPPGTTPAAARRGRSTDAGTARRESTSPRARRTGARGSASKATSGASPEVLEKIEHAERRLDAASLRLPAAAAASECRPPRSRAAGAAPRRSSPPARAASASPRRRRSRAAGRGARPIRSSPCRRPRTARARAAARVCGRAARASGAAGLRSPRRPSGRPAGSRPRSDELRSKRSPCARRRLGIDAARAAAVGSSATSQYSMRAK